MHSRAKDRPNILFLMTDQERQPPIYESEALRRFRDEQLPARRWLRENGVEFVHHYAGSTACSPSRPTLFTGHYPSLHTVTQTSGLAKLEGDPRLRWLRPRDVPTLGDWLRAAGYDTVYNGKWHMSDEDVHDAGGKTVKTLDDSGRILDDGVAAYVRANRLDKFGFAGWVGPEPHGPALARSGSRADAFFAGRAVAWLEERARRTAEAERPFLLVVSFVNPHDICLWPGWVFGRPTPLFDDSVPEIASTPTDGEDLGNKPSVQGGYRRAYKRMYGPSWLMDTLYQGHLDAYRRFYHYLHKVVDAEIGCVLEALRRSPFFENTIIVFTSDHGELLGAHGGMHQKWFNMYEETVRVPLLIRDAGSAEPAGRMVTALTAHVDLVPTLLGLAGIDVAAVSAALEATHAEVHPLVGRDLSALVRGAAPAPVAGDDAVYFMTEDRILEGQQQTSAMVRQFPALAHFLPSAYDSLREGPGCIEGVVAHLDPTRADSAQPTGEGRRRRWKLARYFDDPAVWSHPGRYDEYRYQEPPRAGELERRNEPMPDELELYDLDADPCEARNLAADPAYAAVRAALLAVLERERGRKRLNRRKPVPYADVEPLPAPPRRLFVMERPPAWLLRLVDRATRL
jgi:arylsulfatase A-like enzyme